MHRNGADVHLAPSDFYWGKSPERIHTVLGSCISVTVWNRIKKTGGMCHYLLPRHKFDTDRTHDSRYCEDAIRELRSSISREGDSVSSYDVKVFGGASMFGMGQASVGEMNILCAEECLSAEGFCIKARHVGGAKSRHIIFELETGDVWVRTNSGFLVPESEMDSIGITNQKFHHRGCDAEVDLG